MGGLLMLNTKGTTPSALIADYWDTHKVYVVKIKQFRVRQQNTPDEAPQAKQGYKERSHWIAKTKGEPQ